MPRAAGPILAAGAALLVLLGWHLSGTPLPLIAAALLPAAAWVALIARLDRAARDAPALLALCFLWGAAAAAVCSAAANEAVQRWLTELGHAGPARALTPRLLAPAIEELAKAAPLGLLLALRQRVGGVGAGIVYGGIIGAGFSMTENASYFLLAAVQGGSIGLAQSIYLRALLGGLNHAAFTALVGAGLGYGRQRGGRWRWLAPVLGLLAAIAAHALWNSVAAVAIDRAVCNPALPDGACRVPASALTLLVVAPLLIGLGLAPAIALVIALARGERRSGSRREQRFT